MKRDSRLSTILHGLLHMADLNRQMTSDELSRCMGTNPVVVRRIMGQLRKVGLVRSTPGPSGGWSLDCDLDQTSLRQLHDALGEPAVFAIGHRSENPACLVEQTVNAALTDAFQEAEALLMERFGAVTLGQLSRDFSARFAELKQKPETG